MQRIGPAARDRTVQAFNETPPVGQAGKGVVEGHLLEPGFGCAARAHVLRLQDEAWRVGTRLGEEAAVQGQPDGAAVRVAATQFGGKGLELVPTGQSQPRQQRLAVFVQHLVTEVAADEVGGDDAQLATQRRVGLQHHTVKIQQRHADGSVAEGAVKALFTDLQLTQMGLSSPRFTFRCQGLARAQRGVCNAQRPSRFLVSKYRFSDTSSMASNGTITSSTALPCAS